MQIKLLTSIFLLTASISSNAVMAETNNSATAEIQLKGNFLSENTILDTDTYSLWSKWTPCKDSPNTCQYLKLESVSFDPNGKMTITMHNQTNLDNGFIRCSASIDVPFTLQKNKLFTPATSYSVKWQFNDSNILPTPPDCPATLITLKVSQLDNNPEGYKFEINELK